MPQWSSLFLLHTARTTSYIWLYTQFPFAVAFWTTRLAPQLCCTPCCSLADHVALLAVSRLNSSACRMQGPGKLLWFPQQTAAKHLSKDLVGVGSITLGSTRGSWSSCLPTFAWINEVISCSHILWGAFTFREHLLLSIFAMGQLSFRNRAFLVDRFQKYLYRYG